MIKQTISKQPSIHSISSSDSSSGGEGDVRSEKRRRPPKGGWGTGKRPQEKKATKGGKAARQADKAGTSKAGQKHKDRSGLLDDNIVDLQKLAKDARLKQFLGGSSDREDSDDEASSGDAGQGVHAGVVLHNGVWMVSPMTPLPMGYQADIAGEGPDARLVIGYDENLRDAQIRNALASVDAHWREHDGVQYAPVMGHDAVMGYANPDTGEPMPGMPPFVVQGGLRAKDFHDWLPGAPPFFHPWRDMQVQPLWMAPKIHAGVTYLPMLGRPLPGAAFRYVGHCSTLDGAPFPGDPFPRRWGCKPITYVRNGVHYVLSPDHPRCHVSFKHDDPQKVEGAIWGQQYQPLMDHGVAIAWATKPFGEPYHTCFRADGDDRPIRYAAIGGVYFVDDGVVNKGSVSTRIKQLIDKATGFPTACKGVGQHLLVVDAEVGPVGYVTRDGQWHEDLQQPEQVGWLNGVKPQVITVVIAGGRLLEFVPTPRSLCQPVADLCAFELEPVVKDGIHVGFMPGHYGEPDEFPRYAGDLAELKKLWDGRWFVDSQAYIEPRPMSLEDARSVITSDGHATISEPIFVKPEPVAPRDPEDVQEERDARIKRLDALDLREIRYADGSTDVVKTALHRTLILHFGVDGFEYERAPIGFSLETFELPAPALLPDESAAESTGDESRRDDDRRLMVVSADGLGQAIATLQNVPLILPLRPEETSSGFRDTALIRMTEDGAVRVMVLPDAVRLSDPVEEPPTLMSRLPVQVRDNIRELGMGAGLIALVGLLGALGFMGYQIARAVTNRSDGSETVEDLRQFNQTTLDALYKIAADALGTPNLDNSTDVDWVREQTEAIKALAHRWIDNYNADAIEGTPAQALALFPNLYNPVVTSAGSAATYLVRSNLLATLYVAVLLAINMGWI